MLKGRSCITFVDVFEQSLHSKQNNRQSLNHLLEFCPPLSEYLSKFHLPLTGDFPTGRGIIRGVARIFQRGVTLCHTGGYLPDCHYGQDIIMAFSPPVVGRLV